MSSPSPLDLVHARRSAHWHMATLKVAGMTERERWLELIHRITDEMEDCDYSDEELLVALYPRPATPKEKTNEKSQHIQPAQKAPR